jgi:hypothetical protein
VNAFAALPTDGLNFPPETTVDSRTLFREEFGEVTGASKMTSEQVLLANNLAEALWHGAMIVNRIDELCAYSGRPCLCC